MRRRIPGQSLVEMAFVAPVLVVILFGIIDLSWYIYGYATVYQSARNAAEVAASLPPGKSQIGLSKDDPNAPPGPPNPDDICVNSILAAVSKGAVMFPDIGQAKNVRIRYPAKNNDGTPLRVRGASIEVSIQYDIQPLTPLWNLISLGTRGTMHVETTARRTIENLGQNPSAINGVVCQPD